MRNTEQLRTILSEFHVAVIKAGGEADLINQIIDPFYGKDDREDSCWIDACPQDREEYPELGEVAHVNDYCVPCAEKIVAKLLAQYPDLKGEVYINDDGVDADSAPDCFECYSLITYRLVSENFELGYKLNCSFDPTSPSHAYELHRLMEYCETDISPEDIRTLALRTFYYRQSGE